MTRIGRVLAGLLLVAAPAAAQTYTTSPPPYLLATNNSLQIFSNACIWTYIAGTTTEVATYRTASGTLNSNPIRSDGAGRFTAFLIPGNTYRFIYETSCTPPSHGTLLHDADNIAAMPASAASVDVQGTAGESITAGQCVYLSDGSGAKTPGSWYKCDSTNTYSSTLPEVGIATAAIASAGTGTVRISGRVTGLASLSATSDYFVSTSGALTSTAPSNRRYLGHADSATSLILTGDPPPITLATSGSGLSVTSSSTGYTIQRADPGIPCGRLTLESGNPVSTSDQTAKTTLFYTPVGCNTIALYDGSKWNTRTLTELSIAVPATTVTIYDVYVFDNSGTPALELNAWTNDTTPATAHSGATFYQDGAPIKAGTSTRRFVGLMRTASSSGTTEDSFTKRFVWNYYNRVPRTLKRFEATDSWGPYNTATYRQANASSSNQVECVIGVADVEVVLTLTAMSRNDTAADNSFISISDQATTVSTTPDSNVTGQALHNNVVIFVPGQAVLRKYPVVGHHVFGWLEQGSGANNTIWYGDNGAPAKYQSGLLGFIQG